MAFDAIESLFSRSASPRDDLDENTPLHASLPDGDDTAGPEAPGHDQQDAKPFSWFEYSIFVLLGIAMLWAWNMFLAAAPYFQTRFAASPTISSFFQPLILTVSTLTNLTSVLLLQNMQQTASYTLRISLALGISTATFALLTLSTWLLAEIPSASYLVFVLAAVAASSSSSGMIQNGAFAFAAGFGRGEYTQALMVGQAVAGVVPPISEVLSVLFVPGGAEADADDALTSSDSGHGMSGAAAFVYFSTAVVVSGATLFAFGPLARRHPSSSSSPPARRSSVASLENIQSAESAARRSSIPLLHLLSRLRWHAFAVFATFALTMVYPVLTTRILSVHTPTSSSPPTLLHPAAFIPLAFLSWNLGDLLGRIATSALPHLPPFLLSMHPRILALLALSRGVFIPLYAICNIDGAGSWSIASDAFYLVVVQGGFGLTNGFIGSISMMAATMWVDVHEREAAGGFMVLCLVAGLAAGSVMSFLVAALF